MRFAGLVLALAMAALPVRADSNADRLFDAMGLPGLIAAFAQDGRQSIADLDAGFLGGLGGDVFAETVQRLYDPARLEAELRAGFAQAVSPEDARKGLVFFETEQIQQIVSLEVEARQAMVDDALEEAVKSSSGDASDAVMDLLEVRDLVAVNTDIAMAARFAFFDGIAATAPGMGTPDIEGQRGITEQQTRAWVTGYYMLVASALPEGEVEIYTAFWETDVGQGIDAALSTAFEDSYVSLSYALGQVIGRLLPQNDL